jgi:hypothetical protein
MSLTSDDQQRIVEWLGSDQDYNLGVALFERLGKNQILKKLFPGKEVRYSRKLTYELTKLTGRPLVPIPVKMERELKPPISSPEDLPEEMILRDGTLPKVMGRVIREYGRQYTRRSIHHKAMRTIPPDNRPENVEARKKLVDQIEVASLRMEELYLAKRAFEKDGTLPDEATLFPGKVKEPKPLLSQDEIQKQLANAQKSLNKDLILLTYQSLKKQAHRNPMPKGPKRAEIEKRVKEKRTRINNLQKQLDGAGSNG